MIWFTLARGSFDENIDFFFPAARETDCEWRDCFVAHFAEESCDMTLKIAPVPDGGCRHNHELTCNRSEVIFPLNQRMQKQRHADHTQVSRHAQNIQKIVGMVVVDHSCAREMRTRTSSQIAVDFVAS